MCFKENAPFTDVWYFTCTCGCQGQRHRDFTEPAYISAKKAAFLLQCAWSGVIVTPDQLFTSLPQSVVCVSREAVFLGPASTALQRASSGRSGRSCQQADGQVCCKVSAETALPAGKGANNGGKILGPNSHTFWGRVEVEGISRLSLDNKSWQLMGLDTPVF